MTGTWLLPEKAPTKNPRNGLLPDSVLLLPRVVTLVCTAGRSPASVMLDVNVMVSPFAALVMALRRLVHC